MADTQKVTLDGEPVYINDKIFDTRRGVGVVVEVDKEGFYAVHKGTTRVRYLKDGAAPNADTRTCFWHEPLIIAPDKDINLWRNREEMVLKLLGSVYDYIKKVSGGA